MAKVVGIKNPLLRFDFSETWALTKAVDLLKQTAQERIERWSKRLDDPAAETLTPERRKMYQGFLRDATRDLAMAEQIRAALEVYDARRTKRVGRIVP